MKTRILVTSCMLLVFFGTLASLANADEAVVKSLKCLVRTQTADDGSQPSGTRYAVNCPRAKIRVWHFEPLGSLAGAEITEVEGGGPATGILKKGDFVLLAGYEMKGMPRVVAIGCRSGFVRMNTAVADADPGDFDMIVVREGVVMAFTIVLP